LNIISGGGFFLRSQYSNGEWLQNRKIVTQGVAIGLVYKWFSTICNKKSCFFVKNSLT
jgi:hypothetical protein